MRYTTAEEAARARVSLDVGNIHVTGSVKGMQSIYNWPKGGQVRVGAYIYNVGPANIDKLRAAGVLRGERR